MSPDGISMLATLHSDWLMYFTSEAKPPESGLSSPEPKSPSTTSVLAVSAGGSNSSFTSVNLPMLLHCMSLSLLTAQSAESLLPMLKRYAFTEYPSSAIILATASASPPLLPGPANTTTSMPLPHTAVIPRVRALAARSIRSMDFMGSLSMVYLSSSRICVQVSIFISAKILINWIVCRIV